jgi:hypothetical protein
VLDLVSYAGIALGNGDGTFRTGLSASYPLAIADFNGDGRADIVTFDPAGMAVFFGTGGPSISISTATGTPQSAPVGTPFAAPLQVLVLNAGMPVSGATVSFASPASGASATLSSSTAITNTAGVASVIAAANNVEGAYLVTARTGEASTSFSLTNIPSGLVNLALHKAAAQSTTLPGLPNAAAASAVDGNTGGQLLHQPGDGHESANQSLVAGGPRLLCSHQLSHHL